MLGYSQLQLDLCSLSWELASFLFPLTSLLKPHATIIRPQLHDIIASLHAHGRAGLRSLLTAAYCAQFPARTSCTAAAWEKHKWIKRFQSVLGIKSFLTEHFPSLGSPCTTVKNAMQLCCGPKGTFQTKSTLSIRAPAPCAIKIRKQMC